MQSGDQNRLDALNRQLADAAARSKDAQNAAEDSEANWRSSSALLECCRQDADTASDYVIAAEAFIQSATTCHRVATAALEAHSLLQYARNEALDADDEAHTLEERLKLTPSDDAPTTGLVASGVVVSASTVTQDGKQLSELCASQSIAEGRCNDAHSALKDALQRMEHAEFVLGHLKSSVACRQDSLQALRNVLTDREKHHTCAQQLLCCGSDLRAALRQRSTLAAHAAEVRSEHSTDRYPCYFYVFEIH